MPKQIADSESLCARWVTLEEFKGLDKIRGWELLEWGTYLQNGGQIYPPEVLARESDMVKARGDAFAIPNKGNEEIKSGDSLINLATFIVETTNVDMGILKQLMKAAKPFINGPFDKNQSDQTLTHVLLSITPPIKPVVLSLYLTETQPDLSLQANSNTPFHMVVQDNKLIPQLAIMLEYIGENREVLKIKNRDGFDALELAAKLNNNKAAAILAAYS